jgi:UMF1 family MFS transporter
MEKGNKKIIRAWTFYDWANSVYPLVISTSIFPVYYGAVTKNAAVELGLPENMVLFFGQELSNTVLFSYIVAASYLVVSLFSPILSGIADYTGNKKMFLRFFCYLGAISTASLYFFDAHHLELSMLSIFFAGIGFWNSLVFYNAYLPEIAEKKDHDSISARGFSMGYIGASILLIFSLISIQVLGWEAKYSFLMVAVWWIGFSHVTYAYLPSEKSKHKITRKILGHGFKELGKVWKFIKTTKRLKRYLYSFFMLGMGVQTIMTMAVLFADRVVFSDTDDKSGLIVAVLIIQFIAIPGSFLFSYLSGKIGNLNTLMISMVIWIFGCLFAFFFVTEPLMFYILAGIVGLVMGGTQSLSRSTYSKFLPETEDTASFFSFYDVTEKLGMVLGVFLFGLVENLTGDIKQSVLALIIFFVLAIVILKTVPKEEK